MNKKQYIIPECVMLLMEPALHLAAGSDPNVKADPSNPGADPSTFESKEGSLDDWSTWEED